VNPEDPSLPDEEPKEEEADPSPENGGLGTGELEAWLWGAACEIRGATDAPKFKDYILPLIFIKRLSDVFEDELDQLARKFGDLDTAVELVQEDASLVRFYVPPDARWPAIRKLGANIGQRLTDVVRLITKANPSLQGVLDIVDFNATVSGQRIIEDDRLSRLIEVLSRHRLGINDVEPDVLGRAYEYLLRKFAEGQGQSAGEFFTPREVGWLMARLLRPRPGMTVYDPACGSAGLLIKAQLIARKDPDAAKRPLQLFGQERNHATYAIAKMNMIVHDMQGEIAIGDTLRNPKFTAGASQLRAFDLVTANPMWNQPGYDQNFYDSDSFARFSFGHPPAGTADWGWLQHMLASLDTDGRGAVVLDAAAVSRGTDSAKSREKSIRQRFVDDDLIEAVILLPENLFYNTPAQGIIVVFNGHKEPKRADDILLIDASDEFARRRPKNFLTDAGGDRIAAALDGWSSDDGFSMVVSRDAVAQRNYNLNPARYIERSVIRDAVDIPATIESVSRLGRDARELDHGLASVLAALTPSGNDSGRAPDGWIACRFHDLADFTLGRTPPRKRADYFVSDNGYPWVTITDMADRAVVLDTKEHVSQEAAHEVFRDRLVSAGSLLMSIKLTIGRTTFLGVPGFHNEAILSIQPDESRVLPRYLFYLLPLIDYRRYQDRAVKGQTISSAKVKNMELVLPPFEQQAEIVRVLDQLDEVIATERAIAANRTALRTALTYQLVTGQLVTGDGGRG
jgi:type I restriction enzyme M protein